MSTNDNLTPSDENSSEQAITIQPSGITAYPGSGDWMPANGNEPGKEGAGGLAVLHAVRRHWLLISSSGLACAVATFFVLLFWVFLPQYKAMALLQLAPSNPKVLTTVAGDQQITGEFDIFRENQAALMKSEIVITAALRDERLKTNLRRQQEDEKHNGIAWLTSQIQVDFPSKNAGIMQVSVREPDKKEAADIANAVVEAYLEVVVNRDRRQRRDRLDELTKIATEKEIEVHRKRDDLKRDLENIGVGDEQNVASRTNLAQNMYVEYQRQFLAMKSENRMLQSKLQVSTQTLKELEDANIKDTEKVPEMEVVMLLNNNPVYRDLQSRVAMLEQIYKMHITTAQMAQPGMSQNPGFARTMAEREATKNQLELLKAESRKLVRNAKVIELKREISRLTHQVDISDRELQGFEKQVENKQKEAENVGRISVSIQMERAEVENIERILKTVAEERERLNVELKSVVERVTVPSGNPHEAAAVPEAEDGFWLRVMKIGFGSVLAMFLPIVGIVVLDLRKERINSVGDVSKRLKIPVIGAVPMIPPPVMRRLGDTTPKSQIWKMRFTESVDGVAARLLRKAEGDRNPGGPDYRRPERRRQDNLGYPTGHEPGPLAAESRAGGLRFAAAPAGRGHGTSAGTGNLRGPPRRRRCHGHGPANRNRVPLRGYGRLVGPPGAGGDQQRHRGKRAGATPHEFRFRDHRQQPPLADRRHTPGLSTRGCRRALGFPQRQSGFESPGGPGNARRFRCPQRGSGGYRRRATRQREEPGVPGGDAGRASPVGGN